MYNFFIVTCFWHSKRETTTYAFKTIQECREMIRFYKKLDKRNNKKHNTHYRFTYSISEVVFDDFGEPYMKDLKYHY